jgi:hypothetical protein
MGDKSLAFVEKTTIMPAITLRSFPVFSTWTALTRILMARVVSGVSSRRYAGF